MQENRPLEVDTLRQVMLWPIQLISHGGQQIQQHWEYLCEGDTPTAWQPVGDEFSSAAACQFSERRYREFVTFLPFAQRVLYGDGMRAGDDPKVGRSPIRVFTREDVQQVRVSFGDNPEPILLKVDHVDLYFFYDIDVAVLVVEVIGNKLTLPQALDIMFRLGRAYPSHWESNGRGGHCARRVEWLDAGGEVLATSDYEHKERFLQFVRDHRVPRVASHWEYLLRPLVQHYSDEEGLIRYREIEYQRMPLMTYLAFNDVSLLTRADMVRIGLVTRPGDSGELPYSEGFLRDFEEMYCYDRHWDEGSEQSPGNNRFICNGQSFTAIGNAGDRMFTDKETGVVSQFRHQYFLMFLIAHFQKAALLMLADRLMSAISRLDIDDPLSMERFRCGIQHTMEVFLRFTHRYWFHAVSDQAQSRDLFSMMLQHLGTRDLFERTRRRILDMTEYLDSNQSKHHSETVTRLTVVTAFGLIGTVVTGILGMNLFAEADSPPLVKLAYFMVVFVPVTALTLYTFIKSQRLSDFLDALSNEHMEGADKWQAFLNIWKEPN